MGRYTRPSGTKTNFNNYNSEKHHKLYEDLAIEAIKQWGIDVLYVPRVIDEVDSLYNEDDMSSYEQAIPIEMYIKNTSGFGGDGIFMKDFGYEMRQEMTFTVAKRVFEQEVMAKTGALRPNEGDLIYFPLAEKCFRIRFNDHLAQFYQLGRLRVYDLICETFEYSSERFSTGVPEIDRIMPMFTNALEDYALRGPGDAILYGPEGNMLLAAEYGQLNDAFDWERQNEEFTVLQANTAPTEDDDVIDWTETDPFSHTGRY